MNHLLLKLLNARADADAVVGVDLEFQPALGWGIWLLLAAAAVTLAVLSYRPRDLAITPARRRILTTLRVAAFIALALVLLRPTLNLTVEGLVRQTLLLLFDQSASLSLRDPRPATPDQVRAAIAQGTADARGGLNQRPTPPSGTQASRLELLQAALTNDTLSLIPRLQQEFDLRAAGFSGQWAPLAGRRPGPATNLAAMGIDPAALAAELRADGRETAPGIALHEVLARERGQALGAVVMFTDGIRNSGPDPRDAIGELREAGVALHVVGLGTTSPGDVQIVSFSAPEAAFARDEIQVTARLRGRGLEGQSTPVTLALNGTPRAEAQVTFGPDGEAEARLQLVPEEPGDFELQVEVPPRPDEILPENNRESRRLRVLDDRVRVLFLEQSPRWEFRYLQALLLRDRRIELKCVLFDGDPAIARTPDSPYLESFPSRREDLFGYDVVIFGDVDPRNFTPAQLDALAEFVSRSGGSLLMLAGRRFSPWAYRDTALAGLLPVDFERRPPGAAATSLHERPLKLALTPAGATSPLLRLSDDPAENRRRWETLPPIFWTAPVLRPKPAAEVLLVHLPEGADATPVPVIALEQYGVGRTMFVGTDNTWRWRRHEGEEFYTSLWARLIQRLAIHHLISGSRRTQIAVSQLSATPGERVGVSARLYTSAFEPFTEPTVAARLTRDATESQPAVSTEIILRAVPDQPGSYQGELVAPAPGRYRLRAGIDAEGTSDFTVQDRIVESGETALQEATLREWAELGGGAFFREEDLHRLPEAARRQVQRVRSKINVDLWSSPLAFLGIFGLLAVEWFLRKWWQLK